MRGKQRSLFLGFVLWTVATSAFAQGGIRWMTNLDDARSAARRDGRLILVHFYADWCGPCRKLDHEVFPRTDVGAAILKDYVPVKINGDHYKDVAKYYEVDRYPTDIIMDANGQVLRRTVTPQDPNRYIQLLSSVGRDSRYTSPDLARAPHNAAQGSSQFSGDRWGPPSGPQSPDWSRSAHPSNQREPAYPPSDGRFSSHRGAEPRRDGQTAANPYARQSQSGAGYAGQYPGGGYQPAVATVRPPTGMPARPPRGTYNSHVAPRSDPRSSPRMDDSGRGGQPPAGYDDGWRPRVAGPTRESQQRVDGNSNQVARNARPSNDYSRQRFASNPTAPAVQEPPRAMDGFCPVTLQEEEKWRRGDPQWGAIHRGATFLFATQRHQQRFLADPDRFSPILSGYDPVRYVDSGEPIPGSREYGIWLRGKIYLFADEASLVKFQRSPDYYVQKAHELMMRAGR